MVELLIDMMLEDATNIITALAAVAAVIFAALAYSNTARTEFAQVLRPQLRVRGIDLTVSAGATFGSLQVLNFGQTRAIIEHSGCYWFFGDELPPHPGFGTRRIWIEPGTPVEGSSGIKPDFCWRDDRSASPTKHGKVFVWGWVSFRDDKGVVRHHDFVQVRPRRGRSFEPLIGSDYTFAG